MLIPSRCITVASAGLADVGIDGANLVIGGVTAVVYQATVRAPKSQGYQESRSCDNYSNYPTLVPA